MRKVNQSSTKFQKAITLIKTDPTGKPSDWAQAHLSILGTAVDLGPEHPNEEGVHGSCFARRWRGIRQTWLTGRPQWLADAMKAYGSMCD